jgi:glutaredoxin 3
MSETTTAEVIIYVTPICPYCVRAKGLFDKLGVPYTEIDVSENVAIRQEMQDSSGGRTSVPQIFINGTHIGGSDELYSIYQAGDLDHYLNH